MPQAKAYAAMAPNIPIEPWKFERREPGETDVEFAIDFCGVCHSDLHQVRDEWFSGIYPMVPGHEIVGRVTRVGKLVEKFKVGDKVGAGCMVDSCRACPNCEADLEQYCDAECIPTYNGKDKQGQPTYGGYSDTIVVDQDFVLSIPENLDPAASSPLLCAGITTYSPLRNWKVGKGHKLAVLGLGGLGHMGVKFGVAFGAEVTVLSRSSAKKDAAKALGAHSYLDISDEASLKKRFNSFDFILDTVSAQHDINRHMRLLKTDGVYICVGIPEAASIIHPFSLIMGRKSLVGSCIGGIKETQEMMDFCGSNNIVSDIEVIKARYINTAYERMIRGDVRYRFVIDCSTI